MGEVIRQVVFVVVFPGIVFSGLLGMFLVWVDRKITALVQWRVGPLPSQPLWDLLKLLGKETPVPEQGWRTGFLALPFVAFAGVGVAAALVWLPAFGIRTSLVGDLIVVLYLLSFPALAIILGGASSGNPLGALGAAREMKLVLAYELPFLMAVLVSVFQRRAAEGHWVSASTLSLAGIVEFQSAYGNILNRPSGLLAFVVALLCCQAKLGFVPFDLAEAECEIGEGAVIEYGGAALGLLKLTQAILLGVMPALLVTVFWGGMELSAPGILIFLLKLLVILVLFVLIKNTSPRVRIDQALRFFWGPVAALALLALVLAQLGA